MSDQKVRTVLISAPSYDGKVNVWHATALTETVKIGLTKNINIFTVYMSYDALVQRARNDIFKLAYDNKVDDLVFIDCDVDWRPSDLFKLLDHDVSVVAAPVIKKTDVSPQYSVKLLGEYKINEIGLAKVNGCATGFMRIRYDAIKSLYESSIEYREPHKEFPCRMIFDVRIIEGELWSEDIVFCDKWTKLGGSIYIDPSINCGHTGDKRWVGNFSSWIEGRI